MMRGNAGMGRFVAGVIGLLFLMPHYGFAGPDCGASFDVSIGNEEESDTQRDYFFDVAVGITSDCAVVYYELVVEVQTVEGDTRKESKGGRIKLHDQQEETQALRFATQIDESVLSYEAHLVRCEAC